MRRCLCCCWRVALLALGLVPAVDPRLPGCVAVERLRALLPGALLASVYGATETPQIVAWHVIEAADAGLLEDKRAEMDAQLAERHEVLP